MTKGYHSYNTEETHYFCEYINHHLASDPDMAGKLPIDPDTDALFDACTDGIIMCKLINIACPGTIFPASINTGPNLNVFKINENLNMALSSAKAIGCVIISISAESIKDKREHLILSVLW
jgi:hypothetical protein